VTDQTTICLANSKRWKRVLTGESLFMTAFINQHQAKKYLCFSSWKILPIDLTEFQGKFICQKFILCAAKGVSVELNFLKTRSRSFGGEGFIMQKIEGDGLAFVHSGGTMAKKLKSGEVLKVDTGCIIGFTRCGL
jgi:uncharacterized protein (AIM24 family)